jgi:peptide/nickel transport system permease protein
MLAYAFRRVLLAIPTAWLVVTLIFVALYVLPGDPVDALVDVNKQFVSPEYLAQIRKELGLDLPPVTRYLRYLSHVVRGDLGTSWTTRRAVMTEIRARMRPTMDLALGGMVASVVIGVPLGVAAALRRNSALDLSVTTLSVVGMAAPNFWLAMILIYVLAFRLGLFPIVGGTRGGSVVSDLWHLVLPSLAIAGNSAGLIVRMTRSSMLEVIGSEYIRTARAKGLPGAIVILKHALRNAIIPVLAMAGVTFVYLLGGAVIIEAVFGRQGLGSLILRAIVDRDAPLLQGTILVFTLLIVIANALLDLLFALVDPRIAQARTG